MFIPLDNDIIIHWSGALEWDNDLLGNRDPIKIVSFAFIFHYLPFVRDRINYRSVFLALPRSSRLALLNIR